MFRSSQQRNSRCKDFKVKRALQICVILGVCIWMVYLVQHSREKKTSYSEGAKANSEVVKLGRKDPHPNIEQSSIIGARDKEEGDEEENKNDQNKTNTINGVEDEILTERNEQINGEKSQHKKDVVDQDTKENSVTNKESEKSEQKANKESDSVIKENEDNKNKVEEDNQSKEISDEKKETRKTKTNNEEDEEINQSRTETKEHMEENQEQENTDESNATKNEKEENDDRERNNEKPREKHYGGENISSVIGLNKTEQSDKRENKEFDWESQTIGTKAAHLDRKETVSNVTEPGTTRKSSIVESYEREREHNNPSSGDVKALHSKNSTDSTSDTTEKQLETSENSKVKDLSLHNTTLETNEESNGNKNVNDKGHDESVGASDSSILEEKDTSSKNNDDARQIENKNIDTGENEDEAQNEPVEPQKEKEESTH